MPTAQPRRFAALWRGINVGTAKRIAMGDLRAVLEALGFSDVKTLLNSGNAVLSVPPRDQRTPAELEKAIQASVAKKAGFESRVMLVEASDIDAIIKANPFKHAVAEPPRFLIAILGREADAKALARMAAQPDAAGSFAVGSRAAYLWCPAGISNSPWPLLLDRALKESVTTRNWATLTKLRALL